MEENRDEGKRAKTGNDLKRRDRTKPDPDETRRETARSRKWMDGRSQFGPPITAAQSSQFIIPCPSSQRWILLSTYLPLCLLDASRSCILSSGAFRPNEQTAVRADNGHDSRAMAREIKLVH